MKIKKILAMFALVIVLSASATIPTYAGFNCIHGNESNRCFAEITQDGVGYTISAKITWQLKGEDTVVHGSLVSSEGYSAKSRSKWLYGKEGKSFGYYYVNGKKIHESTAWMKFDF